MNRYRPTGFISTIAFISLSPVSYTRHFRLVWMRRRSPHRGTFSWHRMIEQDKGENDTVFLFAGEQGCPYEVDFNWMKPNALSSSNSAAMPVYRKVQYRQYLHIWRFPGRTGLSQLSASFCSMRCSQRSRAIGVGLDLWEEISDQMLDSYLFFLSFSLMVRSLAS